MCRLGARPPRAARSALPTLAAVLAASLVSATLLATPPSATAIPSEPHLLLDVYGAPPPEPSAETALLASFVDGRALLAATDPRHGREPWVSDGTAAGTFLLADLVPGPDGSLETVPTSAAAGDRAFFVTSPSPWASKRALWSTDGTAAGTVRLVDGLLALSGKRGPILLADGAGRVFLLAMNRHERPGLWVSDGTPVGTHRLPHAGLPGQQAGEWVAALDGRVLFVAGTGIGGTQELWGSDGTAAGTRRLLPGPVAGPPYEHPFAGVARRALHGAVLDDGTAVVLQELGSEGDPEGTALALWRTDGTPAGTVRGDLLPDLSLVHGSLAGGPLAAFLARTPGGDHQVWLGDGLSGNRIVHRGDSSVWSFHWLDRRLLFTAGPITDPPSGEDPESTLWVADPAAGEARLVVRLPGTVHGFRLVPFRGGVTFLVEGGSGEQNLWWSDGTGAGTRPVAPLGRRVSDNVILGAVPVAGEELLFLEIGQGHRTWDLFASDGTAADLRRLTDLGLPVRSGDFWRAPPLLPVRGGVLFAADDGVHGREPWITDGTAAGTGLLADLAGTVGNGDSWPRDFTRHGDRLLFFARSPDHWGLWTTDGTAGATRRLHPVFFTPPPGSEPRFTGPERLALVDDLLFFTVPAEDPRVRDLKVADLAMEQVRHLGRFPAGAGEAVAVDGRLLWARQGDRAVVSDGTVEGTRRLDLQSVGSVGGVAVLPGGPALVVAERRLPDGSGEGRGVWRTDGTAAGTERIFDAPGIFLPAELTPAGDGTVFFSFYFSTGGDGAGSEVEAGLWRTDGTAAGTRLVETFGGLLPSRLAMAESGLFFVLHGVEGSTLWRLPAAGGEARPVRGTTAEGLPIRWVGWTVPFREGILFSANDALHGSEVWVSDGTPAGTRRLGDAILGNGASGDLVPGLFHAPPEPPVVEEGQAFFEQAGRLWRTDGTRAGTFRVAGPPIPGPVLSGTLDGTVLDELALLDGRLLFAVHTFRTGREPWSMSTRSPVPLAPAPPATPPSAPTGLTVRSDVGSVWLQWTTPTQDAGLYRVEARSPEDPDFRTVLEDDRVAGPGLQRQAATVEGLPPGVPHDFRVRVVNAAGVSPPSAPATGSILAAPVEPCVASPIDLCLLGDRFQVSAWWRNPRTGTTGRGFARPFPGTDLTGTFWFFRDGNVELLVKALDGTPVNRRWWLFTGVLTDVEYWLRVVDTEVEGDSGGIDLVEWYHHPPGSLCGFGDTDAFPGEPGSFFPRASASRVAEEGTPETTLDLLGGRYRVRVEWRDQHNGVTGVGRAIPGSDNTGYFWFFREGNVELVVKVLDGTPVNGHHWVFRGGLTDVEYTLHVTDRVTGATREYHHPPGDLCGGADTAAFQVEAP